MDANLINRIFALLFLCGLALRLPFSSDALAEQLFPDPGLTNPKLRFHSGRRVGNEIEISPVLPDILGDASAWTVVQWNKTEILDPSKMLKGDPRYSDRLFGNPKYTFTSENRESRLSIFDTGVGSSKIFELFASGGQLTETGGANLFLAAKALNGGAVLDKPVHYSVKLRISEADVHAPSSLISSGVVLAQVISGFTLILSDPESNRRTPVFVQIGHANSRNSYSQYRGCYPNHGNRDIVYNSVGAKQLRFEAGDAVSFRFSLNSIVCQMAKRNFLCRRTDGTNEDFSFPAAALDMKNWRVNSMYIGLETQNRDARTDATAEAQGAISVAVQVSDVSVSKDESFAPSSNCTSLSLDD